ncbi:MAG: sigma 54-interacting transcriptional regulator [Syntrophales bacterium]|nr:sigma 54-interacting transcriptional regulator [Syntrophales bacterium]
MPGFTLSNTQLAELEGSDGPRVMGADYYQEKFDKTLDEWRKFVSGDMSIDTSTVPADVLESWYRCREIGVEPVNTRYCQALSETELQALLNDNKELIEVSRPVMMNLFHFVEGSGFLVALFSKDAHLIHIIGESGAQHVGKGFWAVGALWDEKTTGNNSVGTAVALKRPVQIFGPQHYCKGGHKQMGSSSPIFGPEGQFLGGIALISRYYNANPHTLGMAVAAAQAIENELRTNKALNECKRAFLKSEIAYSYQQAVIASIPEALITIDNNGRISLINDNAKKILSLSDVQVEGKDIREVFGRENERFFKIIENDRAQTDVEVRIFTINSGNDYTMTCNPILSPDGAIIGKIIILNEIKRAKSMVTKMIGAKANFRFEDICGRNDEFLRTVAQARTVSRSNSTVLLLGESGTGKDIFAQAIHNAGDRKNGPYVAINCAAIPRDLITSELFGYSEGAFTGSRRGGNQGKFELADGGTIFLDEIAETPLELQAVLLRVIEEKSVTRIGGSRVRPVDVRIITATNKDLGEEVRKGNFRKDLYYRLNVFAINLLPLSERVDDIPLLVDNFAKKYGKTMGKKISNIDPGVMETFKRYPWPGNVRELQNVIERMMNVVRADVLTPDLIPEDILNVPINRKTGGNVESEDPLGSEKEMISKMLKLRICKSRIARELKMARATLYRKIEKYDIENVSV